MLDWTTQTPDLGNPKDNNPNASFSLSINETTCLLAVFEGDGAKYDTHLNVAHFMSHRMKEEIGKHTGKFTESQLNDLIRQPQHT